MPSSTLLEPDWAQPRPTWKEVQLACRQISLVRVNLPEEPFGEFLRCLRQSHSNGGAYLAAFEVSHDHIFDWFASRNRLTDERLLDLLIVHPAVREALGPLGIPESGIETELALSDPFLLDAAFARCLHSGGAYWSPKDDGRGAKRLALDVCDAMFGWRYGEVSLFHSCEAWTSWFHGVAWDTTQVVFDRRLRRLWFFAITDTD
jgi:hypothetical protein